MELFGMLNDQVSTFYNLQKFYLEQNTTVRPTTLWLHNNIY